MNFLLENHSSKDLFRINLLRFIRKVDGLTVVDLMAGENYEFTGNEPDDLTMRRKFAQLCQEYGIESNFSNGLSLTVSS